MKRRYTVIEAAKVLGVGTDAVRKRVARGTVEHERVDDTVYVWLDNGHDDGTTPRHDGGTNGRDADLLDAYKDQVTYLRSSLDEEREARRRADTIIAQLTQANAALTQRMPELEAPKTREEAARGLADAPVEPAPSEPGGSFEEDHERPWWRRVFG